MIGLIKFFFGWLTSGPLDRIFDTIDLKIQKDVDKEKLKTDVTLAFIKAAAQQANSNDVMWRVMQLGFAVPLAFWFASVCVYSVFWCAGCAYPQEWTIAALPPPLDGWSGGIIASLFLMVGADRFVRMRP